MLHRRARPDKVKAPIQLALLALVSSMRAHAVKRKSGKSILSISSVDESMVRMDSGFPPGWWAARSGNKIGSKQRNAMSRFSHPIPVLSGAVVWKRTDGFLRSISHVDVEE